MIVINPQTRLRQICKEDSKAGTMKDRSAISGYGYFHAERSHAHGYLLPAVRTELEDIRKGLGNEPKLFDLGCGNGSVGAQLATEGWSVTGVDPSTLGIAQARKAYPHLRFEEGSAYDDLAARFGQFPMVISLEVVEHVYAPRDYAKTLFDLTEPGRNGHRFNAVPRILQKPCSCADW